jgi:predicted AAA+ superfamily ATPase
VKRKLTELVVQDLDSKLVFLSGPRQVGKTYLAKDIAGRFAHPVYLNYDRREDRNIIHKEAWLSSTDLLILDELHKMPDWKNYIKGVFDTKPAHLRIIVTGSARLDFFRQSGDSLAGRFFTHRLFPLSPAELAWAGEKVDIDRLLLRGGFPEPYLADDDSWARRWRNQYTDGLIREDVLNFEKISDFRALTLTLELLKSRVGSPVSYTSIAEDVNISPNTVKKYIHLFEALCIIFRVSPFSSNIARSLIREPKLYFFDTGMIEADEGARFENLVALSLLSEAAEKTDEEGIPSSLYYIRTKDGREADFCITENGSPHSLYEVKLSDPAISKNLRYFCEKYNLPGIQVVKNLKREYRDGTIEVREAAAYLSQKMIFP